MTDHLDSRTLHRTDCFGQRFMRPGTYRYRLGPAGSAGLAREFPYAVEVLDEASGKEMAQTNVTVRLEGKEFVPDEPQVRIGVGDLVLWHCPDPQGRPYAVAGEKDFFASDRLVNESGYSHVFYQWTDAYGSGLGGVVSVKAPDCRTAEELRAWQGRLADSTLVMVSDGRAEPAEVEVEVGQTVFFAVVTGPGVSVTDVRLLTKDHPPQR